MNTIAKRILSNAKKHLQKVAIVDRMKYICEDVGAWVCSDNAFVERAIGFPAEPFESRDLLSDIAMLLLHFRFYRNADRSYHTYSYRKLPQRHCRNNRMVAASHSIFVFSSKPCDWS